MGRLALVKLELPEGFGTETGLRAFVHIPFYFHFAVALSLFPVPRLQLCDGRFVTRAMRAGLTRQS